MKGLKVSLLKDDDNIIVVHTDIRPFDMINHHLDTHE